MSRRYWNSVGERKRLAEMIRVAGIRLEESSEEDEDIEALIDEGAQYDSEETDLSDEDLHMDDSTLSSVAMDVSGGVDTTMETVDTADLLVETVRLEGNRIWAPMEDPNIDWGRPLLRIADVEEATSDLEFRFRKNHLQQIADALWDRLSLFLDGDKEDVSCSNRYHCPYETGFLLVLFRLSRPRRLVPEMERFFCMRKSHMSACLKTFMHAFYQVSTKYFTDVSIWRPRMDLYARLISNKAKCEGIRVWGFIDGTVRRTCRPSKFQRLAYSGHKRCHGIKFQSVVTPDGFIALLFGPIPGNRHDSYMLRESRVLRDLEELFDSEESDEFFSLYGDPAYPQSPLLFGGFRGPAPGSDEAKWNKRMSSVREAVEWVFGGIIKKWTFLDFKASMKIFQFPVAQYYQTAAFLTNLHNTFYSSQTGAYFHCHTPSEGALTLAQYINLVPLDAYDAEDESE